MKTLIRLCKDEQGITMPEYALITMMIALGAFFAMVGLGFKYMELFIH